MAGRGPKPKDPSRRARTNAPRQAGVVRPGPDAQPDLPASFDLASDWWAALGGDPRSVGMTEQDWLSALDTAAVIHEFYDENIKLAGEVRIRKDALERRLRELAELGLPEVGADHEAPAADGTPAEAPARKARARRGPLTAV